MSAAAADSSSSSSIGIPRDAAVSSLSPESVSNNDLLIVGPGVLGRIVAEMWKQEYPGCKVCGQTATTDHHSELTDIGIIPSLKRTDAIFLDFHYKSDRGPHVYWLSKGTLDVRPDHILNLIHYEDAASLAIAIMKKRLRSRIFVGCDNEPLSRLEIMDRVNRSGKFETQFQGFTGTDGPLGKRMENSKTRAELGWQPKYPSFTEFLGLSNL